MTTVKRNGPHLVRAHAPVRDVLETCEQLLSGAQAGHVVGLAVVAAIRGHRYYVAVAGSFARDPTYGRGAVAALDDELSAMARDQADAGTTL